MRVQVVLPLLQNEVVATGWVSEQDFLTGFALVQAMPGPLFNFAAYLGVLSTMCDSPDTSCKLKPFCFSVVPAVNCRKGRYCSCFGWAVRLL